MDDRGRDPSPASVVLAASVPNSRIEVLEGQGHVAMNTAPERFVDAVCSFVRETS